MKRLYFLLLLCFSSTQIQAIGKISIDIQQLLPFDISSTFEPTWRLENLTAYIENPLTAKQQVVIEIPKITLAQLKPSQQEALNFSLKLICKQFQFSIEQIKCESGHFQLISLKKTKLNLSAGLSFVYNFSSQQLKLKLKPLQLSKAKGEISLKYQKNIWHIFSSLNNLDMAYIKQWLSLLAPYLPKQFDHHLLDKITGQFDFTLQLSGNQNGWYFVNLHSRVKHINMELQQPQQPEILSEDLNFVLDLVVSKKILKTKAKFKYDFKLDINNPTGAIFVEPYYIELTGKEKFAAKGSTDFDYYLDIKQLALLINEPTYNLFSLQGKLDYRFDQSRFSSYNLNLKSENLHKLQITYIDNLLTGTELEGLKLSGKSAIQLNNKNAFTTLKGDLQQCDITFLNQSINNLNAKLFWTDVPLAIPESTKDILTKQKSTISWDQIRYKKLLIGKSKFSLIANNDKINAPNAISIPIFDGRLVVNNLHISKLFDDLKIRFDGLLEPVSLALISQQLGWPLLQGRLSALIPHTVYTQKQLHLGGKLWFNLFDGSLSFDKVVLTDPLSDYSRFNAHIALNNINLSPLTKTFDFGKIEGRVDGYVNDLVLHDWQPVSFDLFVGTVINDN
ncbi:MAG: hypothetical protein QM504_15565, partial [Pseudomonadota bacterium]